jgi:hypothetical protein
VLSRHTRTRLVRVDGKKRRAHRVIMERVLGRPLNADEDVHHRNHNPLDNAVENLVLMSKADHSAMHAREKQKYPDIKACVVCHGAFRVNPRKRNRNKCCSPECAMTLRVAGRRSQALLSRRRAGVTERTRS